MPSASKPAVTLTTLSEALKICPGEKTVELMGGALSFPDIEGMLDGAGDIGLGVGHGVKELTAQR